MAPGTRDDSGTFDRSIRCYKYEGGTFAELARKYETRGLSFPFEKWSSIIRSEKETGPTRRENYKGGM